MAAEPHEPTVVQEEEEEGDESDDYDLEGEEDDDEHTLDEDEDEDNGDEEGEPSSMTAYLLGKQNGTEVGDDEDEDEEYSDDDEEGTVGNPIDLSLPTAGSKRSADKLAEGAEQEEEGGEERLERQTATKKARV